MTRSRVLIVEDRPSVLQLLKTVLEGAYDVSGVLDGRAALELIGRSPIDLVLTDVRMPGTSGFEVLRAVRERAPDAAVVMMTAYANVSDAVGAIKEGAVDYVAKPADADEIRLTVARALEHQRRRGRADGEGYVVEHGLDLPAGPGGVSTGFHRAIEEARARAAREYLTELMRAYGGCVSHAAGRAGMTRESLHRVLRKYGVAYAHDEQQDEAATPRAAAERG
jgi:DNA-binding NtrC family response regulator